MLMLRVPLLEVTVMSVLLLLDRQMSASKNGMPQCHRLCPFKRRKREKETGKTGTPTDQEERVTARTAEIG